MTESEKEQDTATGLKKLAIIAWALITLPFALPEIIGKIKDSIKDSIGRIEDSL